MMAMAMENFTLELGIGKSGSVTATAAARQADAEGAVNGQVLASLSSVERIQGYALANIEKTAGATKTAKNVPMAWAAYCVRGGVLRRNPTRKSPVRSSIISNLVAERVNRCRSTWY